MELERGVRVGVREKSKMRGVRVGVREGSQSWS